MQKAMARQAADRVSLMMMYSLSRKTLYANSERCNTNANQGQGLFWILDLISLAQNPFTHHWLINSTFGS